MDASTAVQSAGDGSMDSAAGSSRTSSDRQISRPPGFAPAQLSPFPPHRVWGPRCSHSSMTTFYQETFHCEVCRRWNSFGWLYRCVVDRDPLILEGQNKGVQIAFDSLGQHFAKEMTLGKYGPDSRSKKNNFLKEISMEQMCSYTPEQISTILAQRDHVAEKIAEERKSVPTNYNQAKNKFPDDGRPWLPNHKHECQFKACHRCHTVGRDKSWVSLNGVLNGEVLPHLATGFSFSYIGTRPCADAEIVKNLGCRPVPLPRDHAARVQAHPARVRTPPGFDAHVPTAVDVIEEHLNMQDHTPSLDDSSTTSGLSIYITTPEPSLAPICSRNPDYATACYTPLPDPDNEERLSLTQPRTTMEETEKEEGIFGSEPLEVTEGIALTEEAVESGTADIMTHSVPNPSLLSLLAS